MFLRGKVVVVAIGITILFVLFVFAHPDPGQDATKGDDPFNGIRAEAFADILCPPHGVTFYVNQIFEHVPFDFYAVASAKVEVYKPPPKPVNVTVTLSCYRNGYPFYGSPIPYLRWTLTLTEKDVGQVYEFVEEFQTIWEVPIGEHEVVVGATVLEEFAPALWIPLASSDHIHRFWVRFAFNGDDDSDDYFGGGGAR